MACGAEAGLYVHGFVVLAIHDHGPCRGDRYGVRIPEPRVEIPYVGRALARLPLLEPRGGNSRVDAPWRDFCGSDETGCP